MTETPYAVPLACNLGAFSAEEREHHAALLGRLTGSPGVKEFVGAAFHPGKD